MWDGMWNVVMWNEVVWAVGRNVERCVMWNEAECGDGTWNVVWCGMT